MDGTVIIRNRTSSAEAARVLGELASRMLARDELRVLRLDEYTIELSGKGHSVELREVTHETLNAIDHSWPSHIRVSA